MRCEGCLGGEGESVREEREGVPVDVVAEGRDAAMADGVYKAMRPAEEARNTGVGRRLLGLKVRWKSSASGVTKDLG